MESVRAHLQALQEQLDRIEAEKKKVAPPLQSLVDRVEQARRWTEELMPVSRQDVVHEMQTRLSPLLQDIVEVLKHQQSRLEVLELTLLQQQTHKMSPRRCVDA